MNLEYKNLEITKFDHDTIHIRSKVTGLSIIFDPFQTEGTLKINSAADVVLVSHDHFDHFSPKDLGSVGDKNSQYVFPASMLDKVQTFLSIKEEQILPVVPLEEYVISTKNGEMKCMAVPAYNVDKKSPQGNLYHPKEKAYVGFVVEIDGVSIYFAGDTDPIPEMKVLEGMIEVLLIPISGVYVMSLDESIEVVKSIRPAVVMPMHYGAIVGEKNLGEVFLARINQELPNVEVAI